MKRKYSIFICVVLMAIFLTACGNTDSPESDSSAVVESIVPDESIIEEDPFADVRDSDELWLAYGLAAYEENKEPVNLKDLFSDMTNTTYLTLYDHWFVYDKESVIPVAEALFRFIYEKHGADALLDKEKRCEYKSEYLRSLGVDMDYLQPPELESFFVNMDFSSNQTYKYIISFDNVTYYFEDFNEGPPAVYNGLLYSCTNALRDMIQYLKENGLDKYLDTEREYNYYMTLDVTKPSTTKYETGNMYINDGASTLHEAVHAMGIHTHENIWLSEGICTYFGKILCFNDQVTSSMMQIMQKVAAGAYDEREAAGDIVGIYAKTIYNRYISSGGLLTDLNSFDIRLYTDVLAAVDFEGDYSETIGDTAEKIANKKYIGVGGELTYNQSTSLVVYLVDVYGIETVMEAYHTQDIVGTFGKPYEDLKADWLQYLK